MLFGNPICRSKLLKSQDDLVSKIEEGVLYIGIVYPYSHRVRYASKETAIKDTARWFCNSIAGIHYLILLRVGRPRQGPEPLCTKEQALDLRRL